MPTSGLRPVPARSAVWAVPACSARPMPAPSDHIPVASNEVSTNGASPVRSRWRSAAAMPPAMNIAPMESPNAGTCWPRTRPSSGGVLAMATPDRAQKPRES